MGVREHVGEGIRVEWAGPGWQGMIIAPVGAVWAGTGPGGEAGGDGNDYNGISSRVMGCGGSEGAGGAFCGGVGTRTVWRMNTGAGPGE